MAKEIRSGKANMEAKFSLALDRSAMPGWRYAAGLASFSQVFILDWVIFSPRLGQLPHAVSSPQE